MRDYIKIFWTRLLDWVFRRKNLTGILRVIVVFILSELTAIGRGEEIAEFCQKLKEENQGDMIIYIGALIIDFFYGEGSYIVLITAIIIGFFIWILIYRQNKGTMEWTTRDW